MIIKTQKRALAPFHFSNVNHRSNFSVATETLTQALVSCRYLIWNTEERCHLGVRTGHTHIHTHSLVLTISYKRINVFFSNCETIQVEIHKIPSSFLGSKKNLNRIKNVTCQDWIPLLKLLMRRWIFVKYYYIKLYQDPNSKDLKPSKRSLVLVFSLKPWLIGMIISKRCSDCNYDLYSPFRHLAFRH